MSYILEALKKAQAERQLGNAPTIHAPALQPAPVHVAVVKKTGLLALGAGGVVLAVAAWLLWPQRAPAPAVALTAPPVVAVAPAPSPEPSPAPAPARVAAPPAPVVVAPTPVNVAQAVPVARPRKAPAAAAVVTPAAPAEENIRSARDLPQEVQQQLPHVAFGGYMYSDYPADRLVLVDKTLRHEGEEIAPGLVLEKLLPRGAVLNFRGTRYRVNF